MARRDQMHGSFASFALVLLCRCQVGTPLKTGGSLTLPGKGVTFLTKFCFTFNPSGDKMGFLELNVSAPTANESNRVRFLLLDDEVDSYSGPSREWQSLSCEERQAHSKAFKDISAAALARAGGALIQFKVKQKIMPRWWYLALADCSGGNLPVTWSVHVVNPDYGWAEEFSTDRRYSLHVFLVLLSICGCLVAAQMHVNASLVGSADADSAKAKAAHPFARILLAGLALALADSGLSVLHQVRFAIDGVGSPVAHIGSQLATVASNFILSSLLLLVSQGKCVSYIMVAADAWRMLWLLGPFLVSCLVLEFWGEYSISQNYTTDYVYTTPFGWALISVDLLLLGLYSKNTYHTFVAERGRDDGRFYRTWGIIYSLWFMALPITALLAQAVMAPYAWYMVSLCVKKGVASLVYASLVVGLWPGNTQTYFNLKKQARAQSKANDDAVSVGLLGRSRPAGHLPDSASSPMCKLAMSP